MATKNKTPGRPKAKAKSAAKSKAPPKSAANAKAKPGIGAQKRNRTRERIMRACEDVILRDGVQGLGINAIAAQTGLGKPLIYRYFGNLDGLIAAWAKHTQVWADNEIVSAKKRAASKDEKLKIIRDSMIESTARLKNKPALLQLLAFTMTGRSPFAGATYDLKKSFGSHHGDLYSDDDILGDPDMIALMLVLYAATVYLAHRAVGDPVFNGIPLNTDTGWNSMMKMVETVFDNFVLAKQLKGLLHSK
ncbi:MAG: TetR/AcrR family transcriptional regulator [Rhodospirillaceae bacterium]|nr:TetR/AcrR family transcriptional regulator [Rhodospirillaceae bacterium]